MKLKKLIASLHVSEVRGSREVEITGVCSDSRRVAPGNLFVARKGCDDDGARYIPDAIAAGAAAIATDLIDPSLKGVTQIVATDLRAVEAALAAEFYGHPSRKLFTVGVTGTNGKTSTTYILKHLLDSLGQPCGLMGTIETLIGTHRHRTALTTPDAPTLQKTLHEMVRSGCTAATLEVSSHGLHQGRLSDVEFDVGIFTNLSQDHLDYHETMEAYAAAKTELFDRAKTAILNRDDPYFETMRAACKNPPITYGLHDITDLELSLSGTAFTLDGVRFKLPLIGRFNVYNALAALAACRLHGLSLADLAAPLARTPQIRGRLERTGNAFVDYAHTPDALRQVLTTLNELKTGRLILVFGCGGDRDRDKRPKMGAVAKELADIAIVTSDNPRSEDPLTICEQVSTTLPAIVDRREAIAHALSLATPDDIVLVAGKGHETQQIFAHSRLPFDDRATLEELCVTSA
jgi:UDP-N-acetylmuramoyl-L-alanyl-D-glutamate--2,6-diaminopimelate ligase